MVRRVSVVDDVMMMRDALQRLVQRRVPMWMLALLKCTTTTALVLTTASESRLILVLSASNTILIKYWHTVPFDTCVALPAQVSVSLLSIVHILASPTYPPRLFSGPI